VTDRRQFLAGLAALPLSAAAGRSPDTAGFLADAIESVPCSDPTPGSVTNPRGLVGQAPLTNLVDAYSQVDGVRMSRPPWNFGGGPVGDQAAASSLVGVTAMVASRAARSAGKCR
jgi:hypothetical protein